MNSHLVRLLIFIDIAIPHLSHSESKLCNLKSAHLSFLLVGCWWLSCSCRWLPTVGKSKCLHCQMCHVFVAWETPGHLAFWSKFCGKQGHSSLKYIKPELCRENLGKWGACCRGIYVEITESAQASSAVAVATVEITIYTEMNSCIVTVNVILWFLIVSAT